MPYYKTRIPPATKSFNEQVEAFELDLIENALRDTSGNITAAALYLRMKRTTLVMKMRKYGGQLFASQFER